MSWRLSGNKYECQHGDSVLFSFLVLAFCRSVFAETRMEIAFTFLSTLTKRITGLVEHNKRNLWRARNVRIFLLTTVILLSLEHDHVRILMICALIQNDIYLINQKIIMKEWKNYHHNLSTLILFQI